MSRFNTMMENHGWSTPRRKFNLYASLALPPIALASGMYFGLLHGRPLEDVWQVTLMKGVVSLIPPIVFAPYELAASLGFMVEATMSLNKIERQKESKLLKSVDSLN